MIGVIGAVIEEAEAIKKEMKDIQEINIHGILFYKGKFNGKEIVFVQSGIGKVNAAIVSTLLIEKFDINKVIFSGVAGSLNEEANVGDIVIATDIVQYDVDVTEFGYRKGQIPQEKKWAFECDEKLISEVKKINNFSQKIIFGRIITGDQFIGSKEMKESLGKEFEAFAVDMESGAVVQVCDRLKKDCLIIRSISDSLTSESTMEYSNFVKLAANNSKEILKLII